MIARRLTVRPVEVPMRRALGTSAQTIARAPLLLLDLETDAGIVGQAYLFCYSTAGQRLMADALGDIAPLIAGSTVDARGAGERIARHWRLLGAQGVVGMAMSGIDLAMWDALAREADVPLARLLGGELRPIRAYNSNGLGLIGAAQVAREALELAGEGYAAIKLRLGYTTLDEDLSAVRAVRSAVGPAIDILVDYNQLLDREEALRRCIALDDEGVQWIEEPLAHDDFEGAAALAERIATPIQLGENLMSEHGVRAALRARASDLLMFDVQRVGGVSGWLRAAHAANGAVPISSHLFPEVSAHLLALTPSADRIEMVDWANPILQTPLPVVAGAATASALPGTGIRWNEEAVRHYLV